MKLYMIRHGESTANFEKRHSGWAQVPLTEKGEADGRRAGELLANLTFDKIFSSDQRRAMQTCALALPDRMDVEYTPLLRETNVGLLQDQLMADCREKYGEPYLNSRKARDFTPFGGENSAMHLERVRVFSERVIAGGWESVAAFCHGGTIDSMLEIAHGAEARASAGNLCNGSVTVFSYEDGVWTMEKWASTEPL